MIITLRRPLAGLSVILATTTGCVTAPPATTSESVSAIPPTISGDVADGLSSSNMGERQPTEPAPTSEATPGTDPEPAPEASLTSNVPLATEPGHATEAPPVPEPAPEAAPVVAPAAAVEPDDDLLAESSIPAPATQHPNVAAAYSPTASMPTTYSAALHVIERGHVDLVEIGLTNGSLSMSLKDGTGPTPVFRDPATVALRVADAAQITVQPGPVEFLGTIGSRPYVLPQSEDSRLVWPGWSTERLTSANVPDGVTLTMKSVTGPGVVTVYTIDQFGRPRIVFGNRPDTNNTITLPAKTHAHANWAFSNTGVYTVQFESTANIVGVGRRSAQGSYTFVVGDSTAVPTNTPAPTQTTGPSGSSTTPAPGTSPGGSAPSGGGTSSRGTSSRGTSSGGGATSTAGTKSGAGAHNSADGGVLGRSETHSGSSEGSHSASAPSSALAATNLARTGSATSGPLRVSALLIAAGAVCISLRRRLDPSTTSDPRSTTPT